MKVLIVEPMKPCYVREISGLNDMQEIVGGHIEAIYPFKEQVAIIANEEGKILGLPFNRPLSDERGVPYDIVCGTFFLAGLGAEDFVSLTEEQIRRYKELSPTTNGQTTAGIKSMTTGMQSARATRARASSRRTTLRSIV